MKVFVTGGAGFIGSWVTKVLLDEGHTVTVFDNLVKGHKNAIDTRALFIEGDLANQELLEKALTGQDAVIHMAAFIEVAESVKDPIGFAENNIVNSVKLLGAMRNVGVKTIVFSSSATVYGTPEHLPIKETDPLGMATNPYGVTKVSMEFFCQAYQSLYDFNVIILRYFNPYGPGEEHEPESHAIPNLVKAALAGKPLPIYWDGEQVRDFIYVKDVARAHTVVLNQTGYQVFNVGTEKGVKVRDIVSILATILGKELTVEDLGDRPGDVMANYASAEKLHQATGWQANVSLEEGLRQTIDYYKKK